MSLSCEMMRVYDRARIVRDTVGPLDRVITAGAWREIGRAVVEMELTILFKPNIRFYAEWALLIFGPVGTNIRLSFLHSRLVTINCLASVTTIPSTRGTSSAACLFSLLHRSLTSCPLCTDGRWPRRLYIQGWQQSSQLSVNQCGQQTDKTDHALWVGLSHISIIWSVCLADIPTSIRQPDCRDNVG